MDTHEYENKYGSDAVGQDVVRESDHCELLSSALKAICLTRDYVGANVLPAIDGWEWYEADKKISVAIPNDEWTTQFAASLDKCPVCYSDTGIKLPRDDTAYCEDCGWPHEDLADI